MVVRVEETAIPLHPAVIKTLKADHIRHDGRIDRTCECGVGHPVAHVNSKRERDPWMWVHTCPCGCCRTWLTRRARMRTEEGTIE